MSSWNASAKQRLGMHRDEIRESGQTFPDRVPGRSDDLRHCLWHDRTPPQSKGALGGNICKLLFKHAGDADLTAVAGDHQCSNCVSWRAPAEQWAGSVAVRPAEVGPL